MLKRTTVEINKRKYTFATGEEEWYLAGIAKQINQDLSAILAQSYGMSDMDAMVTLMVNYMDTANKNKSDAAHLRSQLQSYMHEADVLKKQVEMLTREKERQEKQKENKSE